MAQSGGAVVVSLHDTTFAMQQPAGQRNVLQMWDMQVGGPAGGVKATRASELKGGGRICSDSAGRPYVCP